MKKEYLAIFVLPKPTYEHAKIAEVIKEASKGDFKQFSLPGGIAYVFSSEIKPWNLTFSTILHNTDSVLIVEIGEEVTHGGFGAVSGWLNTHRPRRD